MSELVSARICTNMKDPKVLGFYHFQALPRVGENIRIAACLYYVEQVEWEPHPGTPTIFIHEW